MQDLTVLATIVDKIAGVDAKFVKVYGALKVGERHRVKVQAE